MCQIRNLEPIQLDHGRNLGGVREIRTLDTLPYADLANLCLQPLGHHTNLGGQCVDLNSRYLAVY